MPLRRIGADRGRRAAVRTTVKKGDTVVVISGKDRNKRGKVLRVLPKENRLVVDGVNIVKRHTKPNPPQVMQGGIVEQEAPIHRSNVMVVCRHCHEATRIGSLVQDDGSTARMCRRCGKAL